MSQTHAALAGCGPILRVIVTGDAKLNAISPEILT
jgi:hypothetical protein